MIWIIIIFLTEQRQKRETVNSNRNLKSQNGDERVKQVFLKVRYVVWEKKWRLTKLIIYVFWDIYIFMAE